MLNGKTAIVTGGSRGIGAAIARKLASLGADIAVIYAGNEAAAEAVCADCRDTFGVKAQAFRCNVAVYDEVRATIAEVKQTFGTVHILVNNAGINRDGLVATMKEADFDDVIATNLKGTFHMIRHCCPFFIRNRGGKIINISSVAGIMGNAGQANYAASKAGVIGLTKSVARELASRNVTCNAIAPGFIRTDMTTDFDETNPLVASIPLGRMGSSEDVAALAAFLADSGSDYITGEVFRVDGGIAI